MFRRRRQALELALGTGFMIGPMVYALTLPTQTAQTCACEPVIVEVMVEPAPVSVVEPAQPVVEPEPEIEATAEPEPPPEGLAQALLVNDNGLVLTTEASARWTTGSFYEPKGTATFRVGKAVAADKLPAVYADWADRSYDLYGREGKLCTVTLDDLHVIAQYDGYGLEGVLGEDAEAWEVDPSEISPSKWRGPLWRTQPRWLVADIVVAEGDCEGAVWARDAALPAPTVLVPSTDDNPIAATRLAQFEKSSELAQLRREYRAWYKELPEEAKEYESSWTKMARANPATVTSWRDGEQVRVIELEFGEDSEGCGSGFDAYLGSVELVVLGGFESTERLPNPVAIFDADGDGQWEHVYARQWGDGPSLSSNTASLFVDLSVDEDWMCPC